MSAIEISMIASVLAFGGALLGAFLGTRLPQHHLSDQNKEVVSLAMALVGTLTGMALGLLIGSAKTYYGTQSNELTRTSADVALLGRLLLYYGPEANGAQIITISGRAGFAGELAKRAKPGPEALLETRPHPRGL